MVIIISTVGSEYKYKDKSMFRRTFAAFLHSLRRQTDQNFRLILVGHERPAGLCIEERFATFYSVSQDPQHETTSVLTVMPTDLATSPSWITVPYDRAIDDMSYKTKAACYFAGLFAFTESIPAFWMVRMDSDDLLPKDFVERLNKTDSNKVQAIYCRKCHMYDPRRNELAEHHYTGSLTCNAIYVTANGSEYKRLYYHFNDHTNFWHQVKRDEIPNKERDWQLCITTNSHNSISGRPEINKEQNVKPITITTDLVDRYGFDIYGGYNAK